jgi:hypothetical protein
VIESAVAPPEIDDIGVSLAIDSGDALPDIGSADASPVIDNIGVSPAIEGAETPPDIDNVDPSPSIERADAPPEIDSVDRSPAIDKADASPMFDSAVTPPEIDNIGVSPVTDSADAPPDIDNADASPVIDNIGVSPTIASCDAPPDIDSVDPSPPTERADAPPEIISIGASPGIDVADPPPDIDNVDVSPAKESADRLPDIDSIGASPTTDNADPLPDIDSVDASPANDTGGTSPLTPKAYSAIERADTSPAIDIPSAFDPRDFLSDAEVPADGDVVQDVSLDEPEFSISLPEDTALSDFCDEDPAWKNPDEAPLPDGCLGNLGWEVTFQTLLVEYSVSKIEELPPDCFCKCRADGFSWLSLPDLPPETDLTDVNAIAKPQGIHVFIRSPEVHFYFAEKGQLRALLGSDNRASFQTYISGRRPESLWTVLHSPSEYA